MTTLEKPRSTVAWARPSLLFWGIMLVMSGLPLIAWVESTGQYPDWLLSARLILLASLLVASGVWAPLRPARAFAIVLVVLLLAEWGAARVSETALWQGWVGGASDFTATMASTQLLRLASALVMVAALFLLLQDRKAFFLRRGDSSALAQPVRLLGMAHPIPWRRFGLICVGVSSIVLLIFLFLAGRPPLSALRGALPLLPAVLLFAMMNAFSEEMLYRAPLIATAEPVLGPRHALWLSALFFGIGHYYGVPYGVLGVLLSTLFGYLLGKGMIETRGLFWPWVIHFVADVWIFSFMAIGSVTPGG